MWRSGTTYLANHLGERDDAGVGILDESGEALSKLLVLLLVLGRAVVDAGANLGWVDIDLLTGLLELLGIDLGHAVEICG